MYILYMYIEKHRRTRTRTETLYSITCGDVSPLIFRSKEYGRARRTAFRVFVGWSHHEHSKNRSHLHDSHTRQSNIYVRRTNIFPKNSVAFVYVHWCTYIRVSSEPIMRTESEIFCACYMDGWETLLMGFLWKSFVSKTQQQQRQHSTNATIGPHIHSHHSSGTRQYTIFHPCVCLLGFSLSYNVCATSNVDYAQARQRIQCHIKNVVCVCLCVSCSHLGFLMCVFVYGFTGCRSCSLQLTTAWYVNGAHSSGQFRLACWCCRRIIWYCRWVARLDFVGDDSFVGTTGRLLHQHCTIRHWFANAKCA